MHLATPFDPIAPGESDWFAFNFTPDIGTGAVVSTSWTCTLKPLQTVADGAPQAHIAAVFAQTQIGLDDAPGFFPVPPPTSTVLFGAFSVARIGGFLPGQAGATYTLAATVVTSDGRTLSLSADLPVGMS